MLTAIVLAAITNCTAPAKPVDRTIHGVFVEVDDDSWRKVAKSEQIDTIVIANIRGFDVNDETCQNGCSKVKFEQARNLLSTARKGIRIYVGLVYDKQFSIDKDGARERKAAHDFYKTLNDAQKARITGWYIAGEWHNASDADYAAKVIKYLNAATARGKGVKSPLPQGEIMVAPFFVVRDQPAGACTSVLDAQRTAALFRKIFDGTSITHLLLQDGFAERNGDRECKWGDDIDGYATAATAYEKAVKNALLAGAFGVDLEAFGDEGDAKLQCRLDLQFKSLPACARVIVYERKACVATGLCQ